MNSGHSDTKEIKVVSFDLKSLSDEGTFEGFASTYNNVDYGGDLIEPGAFTKSLKDRNGKVRLLVDHEPKNRVGTAYLFDSPAGLQMRGVLNLDKQIGRDAYADLRHYQAHGIPMELSIGFKTRQDHWDGGVRRLRDIDLWETSLVCWGMNNQAQVTDVKAAAEEDVKAMCPRCGNAPCTCKQEDPGETSADPSSTPSEAKADSFARIFAQIQLWQMRDQMQGALWMALDSTLYDNASDEAGKRAAADQSLTDFHAAVLSWLDQAMAQAKGFMVELESKAGAKVSRARLGKLKDAMAALQAIVDEVTPAAEAEDDEKGEEPPEETTETPIDETPVDEAAWEGVLAQLQQWREAPKT